jgi:intraflagellar transport protein 122
MHPPEAKRGGTVGRSNSSSSGTNWREAKHGAADVMQLDDNNPSESDAPYDDVADDDDELLRGGDGFNSRINAALDAQEATAASKGPHNSSASSVYTVVTADARTLLRMPRSTVYYHSGSVPGLRGKFYKNMMPDIPVALSQHCGRFFHEEDFEFTWLKEKQCPYCRVADVGDYGSC